MNLTGQTLIKKCFCSFIEVCPSMFTYNLSPLKCTMVGDGMEKLKEWGLPGSREEPSRCPDFLIAPTVYWNYSHCFPSFSDSADCCSIVRTSGWQNFGNKWSFFLWKQDRLHPHVAQLLQTLSLLPLGKSQLSFPWYPDSVSLVGATLFMTAIS